MDEDVPFVIVCDSVCAVMKETKKPAEIGSLEDVAAMRYALQYNRLRLPPLGVTPSKPSVSQS